MEGDFVKIDTHAIEQDGELVYEAELSEKPKFMLEEEYNNALLDCAVNAVVKVCSSISDNGERTMKYAEYVARMAKARINQLS